MKKSIASVLLVFACAVPCTRLMADFVPPVGLAPGSQYQLVFVTSGVFAPSSTDINDYNAFVNAQAALDPSLPATHWHVVGSTSTVDANVNAPSGGLPVYNTQGIEVASAATGLYTDALLNPIGYDQFGAGLVGYAYTGTDATGVAVAGGTLGSGAVTAGIPSSANSAWVWALDGIVLVTPDNQFITNPPESFYALSDPITFVPEPGNAALVATAVSAMFGYRVLRRARAHMARRNRPG